jgi:hypothetical protein
MLSHEVFVSLGRIHLSTKHYIPFYYKLTKEGETFHAVFARKTGYCYKFEKNVIVWSKDKLGPHAFIEKRHRGARSIKSLVYVFNHTLKEWDDFGGLLSSLIDFYLHMTLSR